MKPCQDFYDAAVIAFCKNESRKPLTKQEKNGLRGSRASGMTTLEAASEIMAARREMQAAEPGYWVGDDYARGVGAANGR